MNPFPTYLRNTMLLDTVAGKTWLFCTITDERGKALEGTGRQWVVRNVSSERARRGEVERARTAGHPGRSKA